MNIKEEELNNEITSENKTIEPIVLLQAVFHPQNGQISIQINKETNLIELITIRNDINQIIDDGNFQLLKGNTEALINVNKVIEEINKKFASMVEINKNLVLVLQNLMDKNEKVS